MYCCLSLEASAVSFGFHGDVRNIAKYGENFGFLSLLTEVAKFPLSLKNLLSSNPNPLQPVE